MAHKLIDFPIKEGKLTKKQFKLPEIEGRFGIAIYLSSKEIFLGVSISQVEQEVIIKKRVVKTPKAGVRVLQFD